MSGKPLVLEGPRGRIEVSVDALESVVTAATRAVPGVEVARGRHSVEVAADPERTTAEVHVTVGAGLQLADAGEAVQRAVADALRSSTGRPVRVDVTVVGLTS